MGLLAIHAVERAHDGAHRGVYLEESKRRGLQMPQSIKPLGHLDREQENRDSLRMCEDFPDLQKSSQGCTTLAYRQLAPFWVAHNVLEEWR